MNHILVIGGTRNMGYYFARHMLDEGNQVTILNRGMSQDDLPDAVHRLRADRTDPRQMQRALMARNFDTVVDFVMYKGNEARQTVDILKDSVGQYIMMSSGQVYLIREGIERPFQEEEYEGRIMPPPKPNTFAREEWDYGYHKRAAEDVLWEAHDEHDFPVTVFRMPMVNSERDTFRRLYSYILRLKDNNPLLIPKTPNYPLRHVYGMDVVEALSQVIRERSGIGRAYNISQDETVTIDEFIAILGDILEVEPELVRVRRGLLEANGFIPDASPFSERWMSELDNTRSKEELGIRYTPLRTYLEQIVRYYEINKPPMPVGYKRRQAEVHLANEIKEHGDPQGEIQYVEDDE